MTKSNRTKVNAMKSRKQAQNPHGPIKSLEELAEEYEQNPPKK
ncbi:MULTISPECIES: DUF6254 family protein [Paenibacillus]|nr:MULTISPECIES: DUF6254 family protein [Paenibacillus]MDU4697387.1 DUF6254 family protein [Paenibacillus sp.]